MNEVYNNGDGRVRVLVSEDQQGQVEIRIELNIDVELKLDIAEGYFGPGDYGLICIAKKGIMQPDSANNKPAFTLRDRNFV